MNRPKFNVDVVVMTSGDESPLFRKVDVDTREIVALSRSLLYGDGNRYVASAPDLERTAAVEEICGKVFAELPVQAGWCFGDGKKMNGVEWHKSSEVVVACTDCVLILGDSRDIDADVYDSSRAVALALDAGEAVELCAGTLHLAPLAVHEKFAAAIILPRGTNAPLAGGIDGTLRAVNKWLLVHPENTAGIAAGGKAGVAGANIALTGYESE